MFFRLSNAFPKMFAIECGIYISFQPGLPLCHTLQFVSVTLQMQHLKPREKVNVEFSGPVVQCVSFKATVSHAIGL